ncbi:MAG: hypothetical protein NT030_06795 [Candidatus Saganbacteria bacterium]|nr:hypothetical protein [Candidatus Saganbacteria bacterium]
MTTEKQIEANKQNALVSTGPVTAEGKAIVAQNAVKHGIFARDLIITSGDGKEDQQEYNELLEGLIASLNPKGQMECVLVEKITVDFWRLRRVLRFESGNIRKFLDMAISNYYSKVDHLGNKEHKTDEQIDEEIVKQKGFIGWNNRYIKALKKGVVTFDKPKWVGEGVETDIDEDIKAVADEIGEKIFSEEEFLQNEEGELSFEQLCAIFKRAGYTDADIAKELIGCLKKQNKDYQKQIAEFEQEKLKNKYAEEIAVKLNSLPAGDTYEKVIKYEKAVQRSILQNIALLKRLQAMR